MGRVSRLHTSALDIFAVVVGGVVGVVGVVVALAYRPIPCLW